jgi:NAD(P)-dependent dehydrogenase (short-subunit alcohol dehydrogenase family)
VRAIDGSADDIGAAIVSSFASSGHWSSGIDVRDPGGVDITDRAAVDAAFAAHGPVDVVIANAGNRRVAPFLRSTAADQWRRHLDVNLTGLLQCRSGRSARAMVAQGTGGTLVFTGRGFRTSPWPEVAAYSRPKAALRMLGARSDGARLAPHASSSTLRPRHRGCGGGDSSVDRAAARYAPAA